MGTVFGLRISMTGILGLHAKRNGAESGEGLARDCSLYFLNPFGSAGKAKTVVIFQTAVFLILAI